MVTEGSRTRSHPPLGFAVIGAGSWGKNLVRVSSELPGVVLRAVCDRDPARLSTLGGAGVPGLRLTTRLRPLWDAKDIEAVLVATPAEEHTRVVLAALEAGKHVFVEKPLALTVGDAERMAAAAGRSQRVVMVGHILHYDPAYARLCALVEGGRLGAVLAAHALRHAEQVRGRVGAWWALAPHDVSIMLRLFGRPPDHLRVRRHAESERTVACLAFGENAVGTLDVCGRAPALRRWLILLGEGGTAVVNATGPDSQLYLLGEAADRTLCRRFSDGAGDPRRALEAEAFVRAACAGVPEPLARTEPLRAEIQAFVDSITVSGSYPTTVVEALGVTRVLAAVDAAARTAVPEVRHPHSVDEMSELLSPALP